MKQTYIALLRGVNVGGKNKLPMKDLRDVLEKSGLEAVKTYIQSGNIICRSKDSSGVVENTISSLIDRHFGFAVSVLVKTAEEWQEVIDNNPFSSHQGDQLYEKKLNITFLKEPLTPSQQKKIKNKQVVGEFVEEGDGLLYLWFGVGQARSKMAAVISKNPTGTTRNWRTVLKIKELF